ncbi:hypothetical protein T11_3743 [Trichinella zimbabwensis]|uniref:Uncharacterized protein n=1 Tax=Trichinella zimbabwensis TaxID=268475 RepID=A0A0V1FL01_9BILA|nr:hypothetical protein T11_3743 [Trichinella zimbabwensis]
MFHIVGNFFKRGKKRPKNVHRENWKTNIKMKDKINDNGSD